MTENSQPPPQGLPYNDNDLEKILKTAERLGLSDERLAQSLGVEVAELETIRARVRAEWPDEL